MSIPSNSTLATSLKVPASSTRRNGDLPSALRRTEERMTPVCVHQTNMIKQGNAWLLLLYCIVKHSGVPLPALDSKLNRLSFQNISKCHAWKNTLLMKSCHHVERG